MIARPLLPVLLVLVACRAAPTPAGEATAADLSAPPATSRTYGESVEGRPLVVHEFGAGGPTLLLLATIHGDEAAGTPMLEQLLERRAASPALLGGLRLIVVPVVNPDGFAADERENARGVDLNRNFPAANYRGSRRHGDEALSEPESRALQALIEAVAPDLVVSIHQPVSVVDWDGPAEAAARAMAAAIDLPARRLGSRPGSLGSYLGADLGVPVITLELPRAASRSTPEEIWGRYGPGLEALAAILR